MGKMRQAVHVLGELRTLQEHPLHVMMGKTPDGELIQIAALGPGYEVQIIPREGQIKHRCFVTDELLLAWYAVDYLLPGRL